MSVKRSIPLLTTALVFLVTFGATAHAASALEPTDGSLLDLLKPIYDAFTAGHYLWAGAVCLTFAVALARRYLSPRIAWLETDAGGALLVLLGSFGGALSTSLAGGVEPTWATVSTAFKIAFMAAGGYAALKALVVKPYLTYLATKGPAWLHKPAELILWIFQMEAPARAPDAPAPPAAPPAPPVDVTAVQGPGETKPAK